MSKPNYRPDIDGLRAVAVLSVILFHINESWLPGGFLGVDVFFVISGFLITSIISREMAEKRFSFIEFYKRRAKRILPVFLCVLGVTAAAAWYLFLPQDFYPFLRSARSALLFGSNFYFGRQAGYFDVSSSEKPLLHIWSLSVEEQYYFLFPVILLLLYRVAHRRRIIAAAIACLIGASLLSALLPQSRYDAYFMPYIRAYELLIGSLFAFFPMQHPRWQVFLRRFGSPFALCMLAVVAAFMFVPKNVLPLNGYIERLAVCTASALLIVSGCLPNAAARMLSLRPVVAVGLLSYSLYLWHWVVLALMRYAYMRYDLPAGAVAAAVAAMGVLSVLSYFLVENPARRVKNLTGRRFAAAMACYALLAVGTAVGVKQYKTYLDGLEKNGGELVWDNNLCFARWDIPCGKGTPGTPPSLLLVGDSHAAHYARFIDLVGRHEGWSGDIITAGACSYLHNNSNLPADYPQGAAGFCIDYRKYIDSIIDRYPAVIISQSWSGRMEQSDYLPALENTIRYLLGKNKKVYLMQDNPYTSYPLMRRYHFNQRGFTLVPLPDQTRSGAEAKGNEAVRALAQKYPQVQWIDLSGYIPDDFTVGGKPLYKDENHINPYGAEQLARRFIADGRRLMPQ